MEIKLKNAAEILNQIANAIGDLVVEEVRDPESAPDVRALMSDLLPEVNPFTGHPLSDEDEHFQEIYVACLIALAESDGALHPEEVDFIRSVIHGIGQRPWDHYRAFARTLGKEELRYLRNTSEARPIRYNLVIDLMMLGLCDGPVEVAEARFIGEMATFLDIRLHDLEAATGVVTALCAANLFDVSSRVIDLAHVAGGIIKIDHLQACIVSSGTFTLSGKVHLQGMNVFKNAKLTFAEGAVLLIDRDATVEFDECEIINCKIMASYSRKISIINSIVKYENDFKQENNEVYLLSITSAIFVSIKTNYCTKNARWRLGRILFLSCSKIVYRKCNLDVERTKEYRFFEADLDIEDANRNWIFSEIESNRDQTGSLPRFLIPEGGNITIEACNFVRRTS